MPATWDLLATATPGGTAAGTWNNIPQTYTDLVIISNTRVTSAWDIMAFQWNQSTGPYDSIFWQMPSGEVGSGTALIALRGHYIPGTDYPGAWDAGTYHLANYANTTTHKISIGQGGGAFNKAGATQLLTNTFQSNSAVTFIVYGTANGSNFAAGSYLKLYGIKAA